MTKSSPPPRQKEPLPAECRICRYQFNTGILGWDKHIGAIDKHPNWHPELTTPAERQAQYAAEFPDFFKDALTADRRKPPADRLPTPPHGTRRLVGVYSSHDPPTGRRSVLASPESGMPPPPVAETRCPTCGGPVAVHYLSSAKG
jgi:hypothetical protein